MLQTHYRRAADLGPAELTAAAKAIERLDALYRRADASGLAASSTPDVETLDRFRAAMDDDFDTAHALAVLFEAARDANRLIDEGDDARAATLVSAIRELSAVLGLDLAADAAAADGDDTAIDALVRERDEARAARDFARADQIRDELGARGVKLEDTPGGTIWHR